MIPRGVVPFLTIALVALSARADEPRADPVRCLGPLLVATGVGGAGGLEVGGELDVILVHVAEPGSRYYVLTRRGVFQVEAPWPESGDVGLDVFLREGPRHYTWKIEGGVVKSQSSRPGPPVVTADRFLPYDDAAWALVTLIIESKLPRLVERLKEQRDRAARKHMRFAVPSGWAEVYDACSGLAGPMGNRITAFVQIDRNRFRAVAEAPFEPMRYDVMRRQDNPKWWRCASPKDCVVARGPCGWPDAIATSAKKDYRRWAARREQQIDCDMPDAAAPATATCEARQCVDPAAMPQASWSRCKANADCMVDLECDAPVAINKRTIDDAGYQRWRWWRVVDAWDQCGDGNTVGGEARCEAGRCVAEAGRTQK